MECSRNSVSRTCSKYDVCVLSYDPARARTSIWDELNMKGFIDEDVHWESPIAASKICPEAVPFDEIRGMGQEALGEFIGRPGFILAQIARSMKSRFRRGIIANNLGRLGEIRDNVRHIV